MACFGSPTMIRRPAAEGPVEHLPLQSVGVLELVDQDEREALGELGGERRSARDVGERPVQVADELVVRHLVTRPPSPLDLGRGRADERRPLPRQPGEPRRRLARRAGVGDDCADRGGEVAFDGVGRHGVAVRRWRATSPRGRRPDAR